MDSFQHISVAEVDKLLTDKAAIKVVDIRDPQSYALGHPSGALLLNNDSLPIFIEQADQAAPTLVFCYHGNSSKGAAEYLASQGFKEVYSLNGGFSQWSAMFPEQCETGN